jgi:hypothetical protein
MSRRTTTPTTVSPSGLPVPADRTTATQTPTEEEVVTLCRTAVGDALRSVIHFTRDDSELLYLRADLYGNDRRRALEVKASLVESERVGFGPYERYEPHSAGAGSDPVRGDYEFTVRVFTDGFVCRVIVGGHGLLLTAEELDVDRVEEVAIALRGLLSAAYD